MQITKTPILLKKFKRKAVIYGMLYMALFFNLYHFSFQRKIEYSLLGGCVKLNGEQITKKSLQVSEVVFIKFGYF